MSKDKNRHRKEAMKLMLKRADQFLGDVAGVQDPAAALKMVAELLAECTEWFDKMPGDMVSEAFTPCWVAVSDTMASIEKYLAEHTDADERLRENHRILKEAMVLASAENPGNRIITL